MNNWFGPDAEPVAFRSTFQNPGSTHVSPTDETAGRFARVIQAVDADILALEEGPSRIEELELFVSTYLSDGGQPLYECFLGDAGVAQKVGLLWKPSTFTSASLALHDDVKNLVDPWQADVDGDAVLDEHGFTRSPLVVRLDVGGHPLEVIVLHTKSNFINQGEQMWNNDSTRQNYVVAALKNRRRNSTEGMRVRTYLDARLAVNADTSIIVLGDLNDGPGLDYFEELYLSHNVTDILVGSAFQPEWILFHAQHDVAPDLRYTAIFDDFVTGEKQKHLLLDHILLSPGLTRAGGLAKVDGSGAVHHAEYEAEVVNAGANREDRPSDHRPVSVDLEYE
jgi:endonuclease/exonuclease/phosphatase family metal-dependent hydrolase